MRKSIFIAILLLLVPFVAFAGMELTGLDMTGPIALNSTTVTDAGPTDDLDVDDVNLVLLDTSSNNVTIGGFTNGTAGQVLHVVVIDATNDAVLEDQEGGGEQDIYLASGADSTLSTAYGGWTLYCDGDDWFDVSGYPDENISSSNFTDDDWGDLSVSTNSVTLDAGVVDSDALETDATLAELNALDQSDDSEKATSVTYVAKALYDISGDDSGTVGAHGLGVDIPDNAVIIDGVIDVITTLSDNDDDSATLAISVEGADDIVAATAISDGSDIWDEGLQAIVPDGAAANMVKTTSAQEITATVDDDEIDVGKLWVILRYVITE